MKRLLSAWLIFVMIFTMFPATAFAIDIEYLAQEGQDQIELASEEAAEDGEAEASEEDTEDGEAEASEEDTEDAEAETSEEAAEDGEAETSEEAAEDGEAEASEEAAEDGETEVSEEDTEDGEAETSEEAAEDGETEVSEELNAEEDILGEETGIPLDVPALMDPMLLQLGIAQSEAIGDGRYKIDVRAWHDTDDRASMMGSMLDKEAILEVINGKSFVTIKFIKTSIMGIPVTGGSVEEVWPEPVETPVKGNGLEGTINGVEETQTFRFEISTLDMPKLAMYVGAPMNNIQTIRLNFDQDSIEDIGPEAPIDEPGKSLEDGRYKIDVRAWHDADDRASMMGSMLDKEAILEVINGKSFVTIKFIKASIMNMPVTGRFVEEVWPEPVETPVKGTGFKGTINEAEESQTFRIEISTLDMPKLAMYVGAPMNNIQTIRLNFDESTIENIGDGAPEEPKDPNEPDLEATPAKEIIAQTGGAQVEKNDVMNLEEKDTVAIKFSHATVILPVKLLQDQFKDSNVVSLYLVKETIAENAKKEIEAVLGEKESTLAAFDLSLKRMLTNGAIEEIHELKNKIKVTIHLTEEQITAISQAQKVNLLYYNPETNKLEDMQGIFDMAGRQAVFYTDHLSIYLIAVTEKTEGGGGTTNPVLDPENLPDGTYTINAKALKESSEELSMCDELIWGKLGLNVYGGSMEVTLLLKGSQYIPLKDVKELKYQNKAGGYAETSWSYDAQSNTITARFPVESITKPLYMQVYVPAVMPVKANFRLVFNVNSLQQGGSMNNPSTVVNPIEEVTITATADEGGTIDPVGEVKVVKGMDQIFKIKTDEGYRIKDVLIDDESIGVVESYTFEKVEKEAKISVYFEKIEEVVVPVFEEEILDEIRFTDIQGHWAEVFIQRVVRKGIFVGMNKDTFKPDGVMTRGMLATVLGRLQGAAVEDIEDSSFTDVNLGQYYGKYIEWAYRAGIVKGTEKDIFAPQKEISREELAVMLTNYLRFAGTASEKITEISAKAQEAAFEDKSLISPWAQESVYLMQQLGLMTGRGNGYFAPKGTATRAEVAAIIARVLDIMEESASETFVEEQKESEQ